jgi:hypothetical protein
MAGRRVWRYSPRRARSTRMCPARECLCVPTWPISPTRRAGGPRPGQAAPAQSRRPLQGQGTLRSPIRAYRASASSPHHRGHGTAPGRPVRVSSSDVSAWPPIRQRSPEFRRGNRGTDVGGGHAAARVPRARELSLRFVTTADESQTPGAPPILRAERTARCGAGGTGRRAPPTRCRRRKPWRISGDPSAARAC